MKAIPILLFALGAAFALACDNYDYCHCLGDGGNANDTATDAVCNALGGGIYLNTGLGCSECKWGDTDNCHWRMFCQLQKSGGSDSLCTNS